MSQRQRQGRVQRTFAVADAASGLRPSRRGREASWFRSSTDIRVAPILRGGTDTPAMRIYFAGPLFSAAERDWNASLTAALRAAGHEVFLPQEQEPGRDDPGIFATDVGGID